MSTPNTHRQRLKSVAVSSLVLLPLCFAAAGCISSSNPPPPANTTVVVPNGAVVTCTDGTAPPCR